MDKLTPSYFNSSTAASATASTDSGSAALDKLMPPADDRVALKPRQKAAPQRQTQHPEPQRLRRQQPINGAIGNKHRNAGESVKSGSSATQGRAADLMRPPLQRTPDTRPQQATVQTPIRSPYNVNVTGISERGAAPTNSLEVKVSKSFQLKNDSKINAAFFVQDKTSMSVRTTTVGASGEIEQKFSTGNATSVTAKVKVTGKINKSPSQTTAEVKLGVLLRADHKFDKFTSAYGSVGGTAVLSTASPPTTTVNAALGVQKVISSGNNVITAKANVDGKINKSPSQTTAEVKLGVSVRADQTIDKSTSAYVSVGGEAEFSNISAPITTLSAELGLDKVLSADGKLKGSVYFGVDQVLGSNSAPRVGLNASYKVDPNTTVSGEIRVQKDSSEIRLDVMLDI